MGCCGPRLNEFSLTRTEYGVLSTRVPCSAAALAELSIALFTYVFTFNLDVESY